MKKYIVITVLVLFAGSVVLAQPKAKKPTIMVVPSDRFCASNGYVTTFDNQGKEEKIPDYKAALMGNSDIRVLISEMGGIMASRDFPLQSLEQVMKNIENDAAALSVITGKESGSMVSESPIDRINRVAKCDIIIDLDFNVRKEGPTEQVGFNVAGIDAYTAKIISGNTGAGSRRASVAIEKLLGEAVADFMDNFCDDLQRHFDDMFENGREVKVTMLKFDSSPIDFETEFNYNGQYAELADILEVWFEENAVEGRFTTAYRSDNMVRFEQVRMPLYTTSLSGREVGSDMTSFTRPLVGMLRNDPYNVPVKVVPKGLGEVWLILGEK